MPGDVETRRIGRCLRLVAAGALLGLCALGCGTVEEPSLPPDWTEADAASPLSRSDCVDLAMRSASTAAAWRARLLAAEAALRQERTLPNPTLSAQWEDFNLVGSTPGGTVQETLTLAYAIERVASQGRRASAARHDLEAERADLLAERRLLAVEVHRAYDELLAARARARLEAEFEAIAAREESSVRSFVEAGALAPFEVAKAEAELATVQADRFRAEAEARARELALAFAMGFDRPVPLRLSDPLLEEGRERTSDREELARIAIDNRPELVAATHRYDAALERAKLAAERLRFLPSIALGPRFVGSERLGVAEIDVELPLFDQGGAEVDARSAALLAAAAEVRRVAREVASEVTEAAERWDSASDFLERHARALADRRRAIREGTERLFLAGEATYEEMIRARRDEVEAQVTVLEAELAAALAAADLDAATGRL